MFDMIKSVFFFVLQLIVGAIVFALLPRRIRRGIAACVRRVIAMITRAGTEALSDMEMDKKESKPIISLFREKQAK